ncbi:MAG: type III pantothenate kinase [Ruthenibacterium lactatiformans]
MVRGSRRIFPASFFPALCPLCWHCVRKALNHLYHGTHLCRRAGPQNRLSIRTWTTPPSLAANWCAAPVAARADYPPPCVIISMDTAVSITALDKNGGRTAGGAILPGVKIGVEALCARTAQLPQIDLSAPACGVLGTNSSACMQAGAVFGTASMLDGMLERFSLALNGDAGLRGHRRLCP